MADPGEAARLERLEARLTEQEAVIEDLNEVVTAQWAAIDALRRQVERLDDRLGEAETREGAGQPQQPPPHY